MTYSESLCLIQFNYSILFVRSWTTEHCMKSALLIFM